MRIGCLQFAPVKGEINHNFSRADSVLLKSNPEDLDLLVLPELAFTGQGFQSLNDIYPYLEPSGSGISSLWARTTALKYDCSVVVGYAEKVDVRPKWPSDLEYYNSAICVNPDGETVANYRKCHLQPSDETWALEGPEGFHCDWLPGVGLVSLGLSMDINPYKFQEPWEKFDFAFHVMEVQANVVVVTMAWPAGEDAREFSRTPLDPDTQALMYWLSRLEPIIRKESDDEIIVVFCNRCGAEGSTTYAGSSTVLGISNGEVRVYGLLGRGTKELLVVDTNSPPFGRLVYRPNTDIIRDREAQAKAFMKQESSRSTRHHDVVDYNPDHAANTNERSASQATIRSAAKTTVSTPSKILKGPNSSLTVNTKRVGKMNLAKVMPNILTPSAPSPTPHGIRPRLTIPPVESITQNYIESQREHSVKGYQHIATPISGNEFDDEEAEAPKVLGGQHRVQVAESSTAAPTTINSSPAMYWYPDNAFPYRNQDAERPRSHGSDGTAFSDWFESEFASHASVDGSIRVTSGTNTVTRGSFAARNHDSLSTPYSVNNQSRHSQRFPSPRPNDNSAYGVHDNHSSTSLKHRRRDRSGSAPEDYYFRRNDTPTEPQPDALFEKHLAKLSRNIIPIATSPGMKNSISSGKPIDFRRKRLNSALSSVAQVNGHINGTPMSSRELRGRRSYRHLNGEQSATRLKSANKSRSAARSGNRSTSRPVDLSQFKLIEEYPSLSCPVHGIATLDQGRRSASQNRRQSSQMGKKSRSHSISNTRDDDLMTSRFFASYHPERPSSAGMITHTDNDPNGHCSPRAHVAKSHPVKTIVTNTPSLTAPVLERHQSPAAPWVETWMPPLSRSVPPESITMGIVNGSAKTNGMISPPPEDGRTTPRAMVILFDEKGNDDNDSGNPHTLKCIERSMSAMDIQKSRA